MESGCHRRSASALKSWYAFSCSLVCQAVPYTRCSCLLRSSPRQYAPATLQVTTHDLLRMVLRTDESHEIAHATLGEGAQRNRTTLSHMRSTAEP